MNAIYKVMVIQETLLTPRQRRREANLEKILEAAMTQVVHAGFASFSMNKLAAAVDYTPGALYRYFDSRDALLGALVLRVIRDLELHVSEIRESDPLKSIVAQCQAYRSFVESHPERFGMLAMLLAEPRTVLPDRERAADAVAAMLVALAPLAESFGDASDQGVLSEGLAETRALVTFTSLHGVMSLRKQSAVAPNLINLASMTEELLRTLLLGWGASTDSLEGVFHADRS